MKKKILILSLVITFFASTTGVPMMVHNCYTMKSASLEQCKIHSQKVKKIKCCEKNEEKVLFKSSIKPCCELKVIDSSVKDNFVKIQNELRFDSKILTILLLDNFNLFQKNSNKIYFEFSDSSPPSLHGNHIYLYNSIFLI